MTAEPNDPAAVREAARRMYERISSQLDDEKRERAIKAAGYAAVTLREVCKDDIAASRMAMSFLYLVSDIQYMHLNDVSDNIEKMVEAYGMLVGIASGAIPMPAEYNQPEDEAPSVMADVVAEESPAHIGQYL